MNSLDKQRGFLLNPFRFSGGGGGGGGGGSTDPNFANVSLLLHMDGTNGSTTFTDSSASPKTVTAFGGAQISTAQNKFGGASAIFNGSSSYIEVTSNTQFDPASSDYTVELFSYLTALPTAVVTLVERWNSTGWYLNINATGKVYGGFQNSTTGNRSVTDLSNFPINEWVHVALVRSSNNIYLFVNGTAVGTTVTDFAGTVDTITEVVSIGRDNSGSRYLNGYIDELRITKGVARYTSNFTPPTAAFPNS